MRAILFLIAAFISFTAAPAQAQDYKTLLDIPEGMTLLNVSATETVEVDQDLLIANLRYEREERDARLLQNEINKMMQMALEKAKRVSSVKASTTGYSVYEYDRSRGQQNRRDIVWKGSQGLVIKGKKADDLLELVGELQDLGLAMNGLSYTVSPELMEETRNSMLEATIKKLQTKAVRTAKAIGKSGADILQINVDHGGVGYAQPVMYAEAMAMDMAGGARMATPVASPGQTQVSMTVTAQALLK